MSMQKLENSPQTCSTSYQGDDEFKTTGINIDSIEPGSPRYIENALYRIIADKGKLYPNQMKFKCVLGKGSFGVVIGANYINDNTSYPCALKVLSKVKVVENNSLKQVLSERNILAIMASPFIVSYVASYQTPHQLVLVTEELNYDDLLSVIYHNSAYEDGLSMPLATFYIASLVLALSHIHSHGVVYRDLKPENIMLRSNGYIKVIDFGLAKKVPYTKVVGDDTTVCHKTYTLCGTPEYLAPEIICNLGYDRAVDIWSLGVLLYEMIMQTTPFVVDNADDNLQENITSIFTNIAMVKRIGIHFPDKWKKSVSNTTSSLVTELLQGDKENRLGYADGVDIILAHPVFSGFDVQSLKNCTMVPEYLPKMLHVPDYESLKHLPNIRAYRGDQGIFKGF